ncbi:MAG: discoidin domain-containing protein [candidate division WS1 bacterium]|nr:discoidin domain-containing protein [candidate division WS1 bacterium]
MSRRALWIAMLVFMIAPGCRAQALPEDPAEYGPYYYQRWLELTEGENIALGRRFAFNIPSNYYICQEGDNEAELTDGALNMRENYRIWFSRDVVAWRGADTVNAWVDLGEAQPVDRVVIRCQGRPMFPPRSTQVYASDDGETWRLINTAEAGRIDGGEDTYYVPLEGSFAYPVPVSVGVTARYIGLHMFLGSTLVIDEVAVMKGDPALPKLGDSGAPEAFYHQEGVCPYFVHDEIPVMSEHAALVNFYVLNPGLAEEASLDVLWDLPAEVTLAQDPANPRATESVTHGGEQYTRWVMPLEGYNRRTNQTGNIFPVASVEPGTVLQSYLAARVDGEIANLVPYPVRVIAFPTGSAPERLHTSMAWGGWLTFDHDPALHRRLGYNAIGAFPRYWSPDEDWTLDPPGVAGETLADYAMAREAGLDVVMNLGYIGRLTGDETRCQLPAGPATFICPSYRGPLYDDTIRRMVTYYEYTDPRWIFYDIESWSHRDIETMKDCSRCKARFEAGEWDSWEDFISDMGTEMMEDVHAAWEQKRQELGRDPFVVGFYDIYAEPGRVYDNIWDFEKLYPRSLQVSMPSLYVQGKGADVATEIAAIRARMKTNDIIPWLTPGTYGEFPQRLQRDMILETFCNGGNGITYYKTSQADPLELAVIAETIELVRPFEDIIMDGSPIAAELSCSTPKAKICGMALGNEALILVSVYDWTLPVEAAVTWAGHDAPVYDLDTGQRVGTAGSFTATVAGDNTKVYYVGDRYADLIAQ